MTTTARTPVLRVAPHVGVARTETGFAVSQLRRSTIHVLDGTAGAIWAGIEEAASDPAGPRDLDALVAALARDHGVADDAVRDAVTATVAELVELGLVTVGP